MTQPSPDRSRDDDGLVEQRGPEVGADARALREVVPEGVVQPGSDATVGSHLNGFSPDLDLVVAIPTATTATTDDLRTVVTALCDAEPRGFDYVRLYMQIGEPGSLDERSVDVDALMPEAFPGNPDLGEYSLLEDLCAAQP